MRKSAGPPDEHFEALLLSAVAGEAWALGQLWRRYQPRLRAYLGALDPVAADDVCSDTWISVARSLHRFRGGEPEFRSWLFTIATRRMTDHRRSAGRAPLASGALPGETTSRGAPSAESDALEQEGTRRALELIASLPPDQAQVVLLRSVAGLDAAGVAAVLGKRPGTVRVLAHRGLRKLAVQLQDNDIFRSGSTVEAIAPRPGA